MTLWQGVIWFILMMLGSIVFQARLAVWIAVVSSAVILVISFFVITAAAADYFDNRAPSILPWRLEVTLLGVAIIGAVAGRVLVRRLHWQADAVENDEQDDTSSEQVAESE
jgi:hypothetical protein